MIEDLKQELLKPSQKLQSREKGSKADFSKTFNNSASIIANFNAEINKKLAYGTPKLNANANLGGPGSSFRKIEINQTNQAAAGLLASIGGIRKGVGSTFSGDELRR